MLDQNIVPSEQQINLVKQNDTFQHTRMVIPNIQTSSASVGLSGKVLGIVKYSGPRYLSAPCPIVLDAGSTPETLILESPKSEIRACPESETRMLSCA